MTFCVIHKNFKERMQCFTLAILYMDYSFLRNFPHKIKKKHAREMGKMDEFFI